MTRNELLYLEKCKSATFHVFPHFTTDLLAFVAFVAKSKEGDPTKVIFLTENGEEEFPLDMINSVKILSGEEVLGILRSAPEKRLQDLREIVAKVKSQL